MLRGENLVVSAELVDVTAGSHLWGERYHRKFADIFELEEESAQDLRKSEAEIDRRGGPQPVEALDGEFRGLSTLYAGASRCGKSVERFWQGPHRQAEG
jgi:hypothetical protein